MEFDLAPSTATAEQCFASSLSEVILEKTICTNKIGSIIEVSCGLMYLFGLSY